MKVKTKQGERLKRLAQKYGNAMIDLSWLGNCPPEEHPKIKEAHDKARKALWDAIEELTSVDLTPRTVRDGD